MTLILFMCSSLSFASSRMLQIKGSDTLINLVQKLSEDYMEKNPGQYIAVTGGGSGTGIAALINKKCDIADASRNMKAKEITKALESGVSPKRVVIAMDGLSVIVNSNNPVGQFTMDQIGKIFRGEVQNWSEIGGENKPITLYGRQSNSGTFVFFRDLLLKADYSSRMKRMNGNSQIVEAIKHDESGIGYVGVGYVKGTSGVKAAKVAAFAGAPYASPLNSIEVKNGTYPIARPLNQYVSGTPMGKTREFLAFELSAEGQKIVEEQGFFPIPKEVY